MAGSLGHSSPTIFFSSQLTPGGSPSPGGLVPKTQPPSLLHRPVPRRTDNGAARQRNGVSMAPTVRRAGLHHRLMLRCFRLRRHACLGVVASRLQRVAAQWQHLLVDICSAAQRRAPPAAPVGRSSPRTVCSARTGLLLEGQLVCAYPCPAAGESLQSIQCGKQVRWPSALHSTRMEPGMDRNKSAA